MKKHEKDDILISERSIWYHMSFLDKESIFLHFESIEGAKIMQEIKCPHCGEVFQVDEAGYAAIVAQVRTQQFDKDIKEREEAIHRELDALQQTALTQAKAEFEKALSLKDQEITKLQEQNKASDNDKQHAIELAIQEKLTEIQQLQNKVSEAQQQIENQRKIMMANQETALAQAESQRKQDVLTKDQEILRLKEQAKAASTERELAISTAVQEKEAIILQLKSQLVHEQQSAEQDKKLAITTAIQEKDTKIHELETQLVQEQRAAEEHENTMKEAHKTQVSLLLEQVEQLKDFRMRQSTKMIGESLEQHCRNEFEKIRMAAFPNAYFEKDNDARTGSKGDFIFQEKADDGTEILSIMFEMKNEMDTTSTKHKNEDFFKELDKDRNEKKCEYAVLVSMLEADSELYNSGIVDVSYRYEKMYVIRPQFFIPLITVLRNAALKTVQEKQKYEMLRAQNIDISHFEDEVNDFKQKFSYNYEQASKRFHDAIAEIEKTIDHLNKIKEALTKSDDQLRKANNKVDDLSIKRLTRNNPTMRQKFEELHMQSQEEAQ